MAMSLQGSYCSWSAYSADGKASAFETLVNVKPCVSRKRASIRIRASASPSEAGTVKQSRREVMLGITTAAVTVLSLDTKSALAKAPSGYQAVLDNSDNYQFLYPFGWQEVSVQGQDRVYKDVIEPLESVSVNIIQTNKNDIKEFGSADEVAKTLVGKVLTSPSQKAELLNAKERTTDGKTYYTFEFVSKARNYTRHALSTVTVSGGKFYTLTTGANERRWGKMQDKLRTVADSFAILT